jgi:hypothetical protein
MIAVRHGLADSWSDLVRRPVFTIDRDELRRRVDAKPPRLELVMTLGDWEFRIKHIPGSIHFEDAAELLSALRKDDEIVVNFTNPPCLSDGTMRPMKFATKASRSASEPRGWPTDSALGVEVVPAKDDLERAGVTDKIGDL